MKIKRAYLSNWHNFIIETETNDVPHADLFLNEEVLPIRLIKNENCFFEYIIEEDIDVLDTPLVYKSNEYDDIILDNSLSIDFPNFDELYFYDGDDLGATYFSTYTKFKLWAPLASEVILILKGKKYYLKRGKKGVYEAYIDGDYDGAQYYYLITNNGKTVRLVDPYAKSSSSNGNYSYVINFAKVALDMADEYLPPFNSYLDAIIYEANIRDMTIDEHSDILNKGKYLGLIEKGRKTSGGNPAGFDYLTSLGITHLQLMPVLDFATVDENNSDKSYNWGYDPMQYFALEGSYSSSPDDPYSRIKEFKKLVRDFHRAKIRINLDVVYNHVYNGSTSIFNKIVPNYYFRRENNQFTNHSYCGCDVASERAMVRKLIVDSILYLIKEFHVDGFRFDLMGLMDVDTMNLIAKKGKEIRPDLMLYGEGWDMGANTYDNTPLATMRNASLLKDYAFFNDHYRDYVRGNGGRAKLNENGYMLGNLSYLEKFKYAYAGSCYEIEEKPLFKSLTQSINYVECHDNATLYDAIKCSTNCNDVTRLVKKINKIILFSFGIPFFHAGQEIGLSKFKHSNTYNEGDKFNRFSYKVLDERYDMALSFKAYIQARKEIKLFHINDLEFIDRNVNFLDLDDVLEIYLNEDNLSPYKYHIFINPTEEGKRLKFYYNLSYYFPFGFKKNIEKKAFRNVDIAKQQVSIFYESSVEEEKSS